MAEYWNINSYDYYLPEEQIAQHPAEKRDESKLLVYSKNTKNITHSVFKNITEFLKPGDILVVNNCKVIPARIFAKRQDTGAEIELLLTREEKPGRWFALVKPGRKCKKGTKLVFGKIKAEVVEVDKTGQRIIEFFCSNDIFLKTLSEHGVIPLPPYIKRSHEPSSEEDRQRYQKGNLIIVVFSALIDLEDNPPSQLSDAENHQSDKDDKPKSNIFCFIFHNLLKPK